MEVGLGDLKGLLRPKCLYDSRGLTCSFLWCYQENTCCKTGKEAAQALDGLEIFKTTTSIICYREADLLSIRLLITRNHFQEHHGSFADMECEKVIPSSTVMFILTLRYI